MDKLSQYLSERGLSLRQFADRNKISASFLSEIMTGKKHPSLEMALKIQAATSGSVSVSDWSKFAAVAKALGADKSVNDAATVQGIVA